MQASPRVPDKADAASPSGASSRPTEDGLLHLWRRRGAILAVAVICALAAGGASYLRGPRWGVTQDLAVGAFGGLGPFEPPAELARRLSSEHQVLALAGVPVSETEPDPATRALREDLSVRATTPGGDARVVSFTVEASSRERAFDVASRATKAVLAEHRKRYEAALAANRAQLEAYRGVMRRLVESLERVPPADLLDGKALLALVDQDVGGRWTQVVNVQKQIGVKEAEALEPAARPTRIIRGPDVVRRQLVPPAAAAILGLVAGALLALLTTFAAWSLRRALARADAAG